MNMRCDITKFLYHLSIERSCSPLTNHDLEIAEKMLKNLISNTEAVIKGEKENII